MEVWEYGNELQVIWYGDNWVFSTVATARGKDVYTRIYLVAVRGDGWGVLWWRCEEVEQTHPPIPVHWNLKWENGNMAEWIHDRKEIWQNRAITLEDQDDVPWWVWCVRGEGVWVEMGGCWISARREAILNVCGTAGLLSPRNSLTNFRKKNILEDIMAREASWSQRLKGMQRCFLGQP